MKNDFSSMRQQRSVTYVLLSALLLFVVPVYTSPVKNDTAQVSSRFSLSAGYDKSYSLSDIKARSQGNAILVSGRVKSAGKQLRGHIDIAVADSSSRLEKKVSVKPYFNNRPGIGTKYMIGFPFRVTIQLDKGVAANRHTIRLALHRDSERRDTVYDCGTNKAVQEYGKYR